MVREFRTTDSPGARQSKNIDAERQAASVRLRAERRAGELLKELTRTTPQTANPSGKASNPSASVAGGSAYSEAITRTGISERTARRFQELATVPEKVFEEHPLGAVALETGLEPASNSYHQACPIE